MTVNSQPSDSHPDEGDSWHAGRPQGDLPAQPGPRQEEEREVRAGRHLQRLECDKTPVSLP